MLEFIPESYLPRFVRSPRAGFRLLALVMCSSLASAAVPVRDGKLPAETSLAGDILFSILPNSFQRNPTLGMTVNTEVTALGRAARQVSPAAPAYFIVKSEGFKSMGDVAGGEHSPAEAELERMMKKSLAANGYLAADQRDQHPSLVLIYYWGSHSKMDVETAKRFPERAARYQLERASLVGGKKYVAEMARRMEWGPGPGDSTDLKDALRHQAIDDLYFVVASAYDYASLARGQKRLLWRTTMTVNAAGVNMAETLPALIATAAPFFGRETPDPAIAHRRSSREGRVEIGEAQVIEDSVRPADKSVK